jgi:hypothetical protein
MATRLNGSARIRKQQNNFLTHLLLANNADAKDSSEGGHWVSNTRGKFASKEEAAVDHF